MFALSEYPNYPFNPNYLSIYPFKKIFVHSIYRKCLYFRIYALLYIIYALKYINNDDIMTQDIFCLILKSKKTSKRSECNFEELNFQNYLTGPGFETVSFFSLLVFSIKRKKIYPLSNQHKGIPSRTLPGPYVDQRITRSQAYCIRSQTVFSILIHFCNIEIHLFCQVVLLIPSSWDCRNDRIITYMTSP